MRALAGSAELIPLADGCVDAVLVGNALHWFDMALAGPEISRVLAPGGTLAGLWNLMDDRIDWVAGLARVSGAEAVGPRDTPRAWRAFAAAMPLSAHFAAAEVAEFAHGQRRTARSLVATLSTKAGILVMPDDEREHRLDRIASFLARRPETAHGSFVLPMVTGVLRVVRHRDDDAGGERPTLHGC